MSELDVEAGEADPLEERTQLGDDLAQPRMLGDRDARCGVEREEVAAVGPVVVGRALRRRVRVLVEADTVDEPVDGPQHRAGRMPGRVRDLDLVLDQTVLVVGMDDQHVMADRDRREAAPHDHRVGVHLTVLRREACLHAAVDDRLERVELEEVERERLDVVLVREPSRSQHPCHGVPLVAPRGP